MVKWSLDNILFIVVVKTEEVRIKQEVEVEAEERGSQKNW